MPPFRFLVCQQDPAAGEEPVSFDDALGIFGDVLRAEGCTAEPAPKNDSAVRFEDNDQGLIVLGGGQASVWAKESYVNERAWIRKARAEHIPIFGICLGAQLLAYEFRDPSNDRPVHDNKWRRGWFDVHVKGVGSTDPVLLPVASVTKMIHWHYDAIRELPAGADKLAIDEATDFIEAFRMPGHIYGVQFHPELTEKGFRNWFGGKYPYQKAAMDQFKACFKPAQVASFALLTSWVRLARDKSFLS